MTVPIQGIVHGIFDLIERVVEEAKQGDKPDSSNQKGYHFITAILVPFAQGVWYRLPHERQHELFGPSDVCEGGNPVLLGCL
jgi:hypothetical protein